MEPKKIFLILISGSDNIFNFQIPSFVKKIPLYVKF